MTSLFTAPLRPKLRALAESFIPETALATGQQWEALEHAVDRALAERPRALSRQLGLLIRLLDLAARLRHGKPLERLDPVRRLALLERMARAPLLLLRRGIWGLRTLLMLGWYTQLEVARALGYRASPAGWANVAPRGAAGRTMRP